MLPVLVRTWHRHIALALLTSSLIIACVSGSSPEAETASPMPTGASSATRQPTGTPITTALPDSTATQSEELPLPVQSAITLAASQHQVTASEITVVSFAERQWPSSALGCPMPGRSYAQVVTPGFIVKLQVADQQYSYHTDSSTTVTNCEQSM